MALALDNLKNPLELLFLFRAAQRLEIDELSNTAHAPLVCGISQQDNPLAGIGVAVASTFAIQSVIKTPQ